MNIHHNIILILWHLYENDIVLDFVLASFVAAMTLHKEPHINLFSFLQMFILKTQVYKLFVGKCGSLIYH